jgi:hypothetical protein
MVSKNNSWITTRRNPLTIFVGTNIGFSNPVIESINSTIAIAPAPILILTIIIYGGVALSVYCTYKKFITSNKQSFAEFSFEINNPPSYTYIDFEIFIEDNYGKILDYRLVNDEIFSDRRFKYTYKFESQGYAPPLYLRVKSSIDEKREKFY